MLDIENLSSQIFEGSTSDNHFGTLGNLSDMRMNFKTLTLIETSIDEVLHHRVIYDSIASIHVLIGDELQSTIVPMLMEKGLHPFCSRLQKHETAQNVTDLVMMSLCFRNRSLRIHLGIVFFR